MNITISMRRFTTEEKNLKNERDLPQSLYKMVQYYFLSHGTKFVEAHICRIQPVEAKGQAKSVNASIELADEIYSPIIISSHNFTINDNVPENEEQ